MKHFGDITKLNGAELPFVDVITGGSPCQDLSVAGKRAGLDGERSGLFMEQIRLVKEMREHDRAIRGTDVDIRGLRPRYMVWENVPGAFSSNKGKDFQAVLTEIARIVCKDCPDVPLPEKGKWAKSGCLMGYGDDGQPFSIAYRLHDAQFWGVPQRRKRIALVADFGGSSAPEILFESKSVSGNLEQSREKGEGAATGSQGSVDPSSYTLKIRGGVDVDSHGKKAGKGPLVQTELSGTLGVSQDQTLITHEKQIEEWVDAVNKSAKHQQDLIQSDLGVARTLACGTHASGPHLTKTLVTGCLNSWDVQSKHIQPEDGKAEALYSGECRYGGGESYVMQNKVYGISSYDSNAMKSPNPHSGIYEADTSRTLDLNGGSPACNQGGMAVVQGADLYNQTLTGQTAVSITSNTGSSATHSGPSVVCLEGNGSRESHKGDGYTESDKMYTLNTVEKHAVCVGNGQLHNATMKPIANSLDTMHDQQAVMTYGVDCYNQTQSEEVTQPLRSINADSDHIPCVYGLDRASFNQGKNALYDFSVEEEKAQTLVSRGPGGVLTKQ